MINTLEQLREQFFGIQDEENKPYVYWSLYEGVSKSHRLAWNYQIDDKEAAWELLLENVKRVCTPLRTYKVFVTNSARSSNGLDIYFNLSTIPGGQGAAAVGSLPGGSPAISEAKIQTMITEAVEKDRLIRKVEDLEAQINAPANVWDRIGDRIMNFLESESGAPVGAAIAAKIMGIPMNPASMGLSGYEKGAPTPPNPEGQSEGNEEDEFDMSDEEILQTLAQIHQVIPLSEVLPLIAGFVRGKTTAEVRKTLSMLKNFM